MRDSVTRFGPVSIMFHWFLATGYFGLFAVGWYMIDLSYYDPMYNRLPMLHKSFGMLLILLVSLQLIWRIANTRPAPVEGLASWEEFTASQVQRILFAGAVLVLVTGYLIPTAEGVGVSVFGWFEVPAVIHGIAEQEDRAGVAHKYLAYVVLGLSIGHMVAALKHHFYNRDQTLRRMLGLSNKDSKEREKL